MKKHKLCEGKLEKVFCGRVKTNHRILSNYIKKKH